jgi:hypothetical protein
MKNTPQIFGKMREPGLPSPPEKPGTFETGGIAPGSLKQKNYE